MGFAEKSRSMLWFLRRPSEYTSLPQFLYDRYAGPYEGTVEKKAHAWCKARAVDCEQAILMVTGQALDLTPVDQVEAESPPATQQEIRYYPCLIDQKFPRVFDGAKRTAAVQLDKPDAGPGMIDLLYGLAAHLQPQKVVETGVAFGWSALAILLAMRESSEARLISTDLPGGHVDAADIGCVVPENLQQQWELVRESDREALPRILEQWPQIDMCHYDSDKSYWSRIWAARLLWQALRPGGYFVIDDIDDNYAYRDFCVEINQSPLIVGPKGKQTQGKFAGVLIKPMSG